MWKKGASCWSTLHSQPLNGRVRAAACLRGSSLPQATRGWNQLVGEWLQQPVTTGCTPSTKSSVVMRWYSNSIRCTTRHSEWCWRRDSILGPLGRSAVSGRDQHPLHTLTHTHYDSLLQGLLGVEMRSWRPPLQWVYTWKSDGACCVS